MSPAMSPAISLEERLANLAQLHPKRIDLSLGRMRRLLAALDNPERHLPPTVRIAGTNGKGSTLAFLEAIARHNGWICDSYISPHLVRFNERIRLNGSEITTAALVSALTQAERANAGKPITFFEITTAAAFLAFAEAHAKRKRDLLLLEVGLGGRLDATATVPKWILSVLTPIDLDHQGFLGNTLEKIAAEKAAIIRRRIPAISAKQKSAARQVLDARADRMESPFLLAGRDWRIATTGTEGTGRAEGGTEGTGRAERGTGGTGKPDRHNKQGHKKQEIRQVIQVQGTPFPALKDLPLTPSLLGKHQCDNAALAAVAAAWLGAKPQAIQQGIEAARHPARLQRLTRGQLAQALPQGWEIWLDGGHNPAAARSLAAFLRQDPTASPNQEAQQKPNQDPNQKPNQSPSWSFIVSLIAGKSPRGFLTPLLPKLAAQGAVQPLVVALEPPADHQAVPPETIVRIATARGAEALVADSVETAVKEILARRGEAPQKTQQTHQKTQGKTSKGRILICGSLYQAGEVLRKNQ